MLVKRNIKFMLDVKNDQNTVVYGFGRFSQNTAGFYLNAGLMLVDSNESIFETLVPVREIFS